jgi:DNA-binding transcriptional LysR family regulator
LIRTFVEVAQCGSFSGAARALGYTQSAVSQHIAALEADLGVDLLNRRPVSLTPAGSRLLEHVLPLLQRLEAARSDVVRDSRSAAGRLVLGVSPLAMTEAIADGLARIRAGHPRTRLDLRVMSRQAVASQLATGALGLGLVDGFGAPDDPLDVADVGPLKSVLLHEEPLAVLLSADHPLRHSRQLRLGDLADARWIDAPHTAATLPELRAVCGGQGFTASVHYDGMDVRALVSLSRAGCGLAVLPWSVAQDTAGGGAVAIRSAPRIVHRREVLYNHGLDAVATELVTWLLTGARPRP